LTVHGVRKNPLDSPIKYAGYVGYYAAVCRDEYFLASGTDGQERICERDDRVGSWRDGKATRLWPSLDPVQFYCKKFQNFPSILQGYIDKLPAGHPSITTRVKKSDGVTQLPHLLPWPRNAYTSPELTTLGRKLLGLDDWQTDDIPEVPAVPAVPEVPEVIYIDSDDEGAFEENKRARI
jgi:hypothetical protein